MIAKTYRNRASRWWLVPAACLAVLALAGCGPKEQKGDKKEDWAKTGPPPQYHGPGQPGGPASGPPTGAAPPPSGGAGK